MPAKKLPNSIIITKTRKYRKYYNLSDDYFLAVRILCGIEIFAGIFAIILSSIAIGIVLMIGLIPIISFVAEAMHFRRLTRCARFYRKSLWFGRKQFEKTDIQQLSILIDRSKPALQLCFKLVQKNGKKHEYKLDHVFTSDEIQQLAERIIEFGEIFYPFRMEILS